MIKIPVNEIILKIKEKTKLDDAVIQKKIDDKVAELSGLVSKEGAAHIVANEFGIQLFKSTETGLQKIKDIVPGIKTTSFVARVLNVFPAREFKTEKREGKVLNFLVGDETGKMRVVLWDTNQIALFEENKIKQGDILRITNCYVKEGFNGTEVHARSNSKIDINPNIPEAKTIPPAEKITGTSQKETERVKIDTISEDGFYEIRGAIVNILEKEPFFEICPDCRKKAPNGMCEQHGEVKPVKSMFLSTVFDDATNTMKVVFFGKQAEDVLGTTVEEAFKEAEAENNMLHPITSKKKELLGRELVVSGKVSKNSFSGEFEMIARSVSKPDPVAEAKIIEEELKE